VQLTVFSRGLPAIRELFHSFQAPLLVEVRSVGNQKSQPKECGITRDVSIVDDCENLFLEISNFGLRQLRVSFRQKRTIRLRMPLNGFSQWVPQRVRANWRWLFSATVVGCFANISL
jgi:hypothetical protein